MTVDNRHRIVFDTAVNPHWTPILTAAPIELILIEPLPELCSEHGLPARESRCFTVNSSGPLSELPTVGALLRSMDPRRRIPTTARVGFECPACDDCLYEIRVFRRRALLALLAIPLTIVAIVAARTCGLEWLYVPLAFVVVPGCFPIALLVAVLSWARAGYFADVWLDETADHLIVSAHPNFAAAVEELRAESPPQ